MMRLRWSLVVVLLFIGTLGAEVRLPKLLSDHAVLQRERPVRIWGWSEPSERITVSFHNQTMSTTADPVGMWEVWLRPEHAGGPYTLAVSGSATSKPVNVVDILVGDVWIASGQSNMQFPLKGFLPTAPMLDSAKEIAAASHPKLRFVVQKMVASPVEITEEDSVWNECTPANAPRFSAVAYFFARMISEHENVPVGIIDAAWGGTPAHAWISPEGIARENLTSVYQDGANIAHEQGTADEIRGQYERMDAHLRSLGQTPPVHPAIAGDHHGLSWIPGAIYNGMIAPDVKYGIKGVIWYQGETDGGPVRAPNYGKVLTALIRDWRRQWGQGDFPFLLVQLSSFETSAGQWGEVRDGQRRAAGLANTGMAVTLDVGVANNVHPPDKKTVGERLALEALGVVYGEHKEYSSPMFEQATVEGTGMRVWFTHGQGLTTRDKELGDFELAGADHKFVPAKARIETVDGRDTVLVQWDNVHLPRYVRYGWSGVVKSYLYNGAGLPAGTFTSEP